MKDEFGEIMRNLSENARMVLQKADFYSKRYNFSYISTEHILLGILAQDVSTGARILMREGVDLAKAEKEMKGEPVDVHGSQMAMMSLSESAILTLRIAASYVKEEGLTTIGTEHLLFALLEQDGSKAVQILKSLNVDIEVILDEIEKYTEEQAKSDELKRRKEEFMGKRAGRYLGRFGRDLTEAAKKGELDVVIGREKEIERVVTVLGRRTKSNPVLIGEAGVGKTAIVEGLASRIAKNNVPSGLVGKKVIEIDLSAMVAGTKFRGEFEERLKGVIAEAVEDKTVILFIDELHLLSGAGSSDGSMDAANMLKPALARGELCLVGATTSDEYRKGIEKDHALARRFQTVMVEEPSKALTLKILKGIKKHYEKHHGVSISDEMLETAVVMSARYINDRCMPDKAIDVIDEAAAIAKVAAEKKDGGRYKKLKVDKQTLEEKMAEAAEKEDYEKAANFKTEMAKIEEEIKELEKSGVKADEVPELTEADLAMAISLKTGIPVSKVHGSELELLTNLEAHLKKSIIGQNEAVEVVSRAIRRGRSGIGNPNRPIGSFMFMGPTGVGKTELARVIAREVFGGENALIKIDMSEFGEKHNASRLVGAPAGYIGYDDGGKLTEAVRRRPYSVVLFDEVEKAHPDVFNILLQILEDGVLTDGQGNKVKFNNTVVILTSNLGASEMRRGAEMGFAAASTATKKDLEAKYEEDKEIAMRALKKAMKPELINRMDAVLVFHSLTKENVERIFDNLIDDLRKRLSEKAIGLKVCPEVKSWLIKLGYDPENGARPLRRTIEDKLESEISDMIISEKVKKGDIIEASLSRGKLKLEVVSE